mmetsp:Transcript_33246/g.48105  ORF Transcript_33246/g.48105 Transcript_33246/m.48105 type:complete len:209 (-) Transcript_33246:992-1618(-)
MVVLTKPNLSHISLSLLLVCFGGGCSQNEVPHIHSALSTLGRSEEQWHYSGCSLRNLPVHAVHHAIVHHQTGCSQVVFAAFSTVATATRSLVHFGEDNGISHMRRQSGHQVQTLIIRLHQPVAGVNEVEQHSESRSLVSKGCEEIGPAGSEVSGGLCIPHSWQIHDIEGALGLINPDYRLYFEVIELRSLAWRFGSVGKLLAVREHVD